MRQALFDKLIAFYENRTSSFDVGPAGNPYLRRWWIIPRNRFFNLYLHQILRSDDDRALHDHPWVNCSVVLRGSYVEWARGPDDDMGTERPYVRRAGNVVFRRPRRAHRLVVPAAEPAWTLFITGSRVREWGFFCSHGWVHWKIFTAPGAPGDVGKGCGEP